MFNKFLKGKHNVIVNEFLLTYSNKDKYFIRTKPWDWLSKKEIYVMSKIDGKPTMITMDFWAQEIFLDADGQITVSEMINVACNQYLKSKTPIPEKLDFVLIQELEHMITQLKIIEFRDQITQLPQNINLPISQQAGT
ncbi:hypothetical protein [Mucilaginibacter paludis]|uniref:Uncharacterized protein n=1 Tax=Mucilaginibacter paludis DSM 18603 TaxID=714943 RepID=H1Y7V8_9SPHI|nr:hypothetical protein [Mucilaginibacter paludis]EHQ30444.1 hypothetical protein Mucpa_6391 [Mucilaginibacter paludis DSM 18603]